MPWLAGLRLDPLGDLIVLPQTSELQKEYRNGLNVETRCSSSTFMLSAQNKIQNENLNVTGARGELG